MNIIDKRTGERLHRLSVLKEIISKAENPDYKYLAMWCCSEWGISERMAKEMIKIVKWQIKHAE